MKFYAVRWSVSRAYKPQVKSLGDAAITVLGNHDLHLLALGHDVRYSVAHYDSMWKVLRAKDGDELFDWLRRRPLAHYDESLNALLVHAGLPPQWTVKNPSGSR